MTFHRCIAVATFLSLTTLSARAQPTAVSLTGTTYSQNFNGIATTAMPAGWGLFNGGAATATYAGSTTTATQTATTLNGSSTGGSYIFDAGTSDKAVGFLTSGSFTSPRSIVFGITNDNPTDAITQLRVVFDYEKYRSGTRAFDFTFSDSTTGLAGSFTNIAAGNQSYAADANNTTVTFSPPGTINKDFNVTGININPGSTYYLLWTYTGSGGSTNAQALGIDNVTLTATLTPVPEPATILGLAAGGLTFAGWVRRRKSRAA